MKANEAIKLIMKTRNMSNAVLADKIGQSTASAVSNSLSREKGMRIDRFLQMVNAMDCQVIIKSKLKDNAEWKIDL